MRWILKKKKVLHSFLSKRSWNKRQLFLIYCLEQRSRPMFFSDVCRADDVHLLWSYILFSGAAQKKHVVNMIVRILISFFFFLNGANMDNLLGGCISNSRMNLLCGNLASDSLALWRSAHIVIWQVIDTIIAYDKWSVHIDGDCCFC